MLSHLGRRLAQTAQSASSWQCTTAALHAISCIINNSSSSCSVPSSSSHPSQCLGSTRGYSSEPPSSSSDEDVSKIGNEKVQKLAGEILSLSVLEASQLSQVLRRKLDIPRPMGGMPAFAPMMGLPQPGAGPVAPAGQPAEASGAPPPPKEKTEFDVKLQSFSAESKIKVIKEIRALTSLGLKEAKELVEKAPTVLKSGATKEDAENWKKVIESAGGKVELE